MDQTLLNNIRQDQLTEIQQDKIRKSKRNNILFFGGAAVIVAVLAVVTIVVVIKNKKKTLSPLTGVSSSSSSISLNFSQLAAGNYYMRLGVNSSQYISQVISGTVSPADPNCTGLLATGTTPIKIGIAASAADGGHYLTSANGTSYSFAPGCIANGCTNNNNNYLCLNNTGYQIPVYFTPSNMQNAGQYDYNVIMIYQGTYYMWQTCTGCLSQNALNGGYYIQVIPYVAAKAVDPNCTFTMIVQV